MRLVPWEYKVLSMTGEDAAGGEETVEPLLDELGSDGWELVGVDPSVTPTLYLFKRPLRAVSTDEEYDEGEDDYGEDYGDEYDDDGTIRVGPQVGGR